MKLLPKDLSKQESATKIEDSMEPMSTQNRGI